jgi:hypothetical protein
MKIFIISLLMLSLSLLTACGGSGSSSEKSDEKEAAVDQAPVPEVPEVPVQVIPSDLESLPLTITTEVNENHRFALTIPEYKASNSYAFTGADGDKVKLWPERGEVIFINAPVYETQSSYSFIIIVTNAVEQSRSIDVAIDIENASNEFIFEIVEGTMGVVSIVINASEYVNKYDTYSFSVQKNNEAAVEYHFLGDDSTHEITLRKRNFEDIGGGFYNVITDETQRFTIKPIGDDGLPGISFSGNRGHSEINIIQWGNNSWQTLHNLFLYVCSHDENHGDEEEETYIDNLSFDDEANSPNLSRVNSMVNAFSYCDFTENQSYWDVSKIENMEGLFSSSQGNSDISQWDVSSVKKMDLLFHNALEFSSDLSKWDVSAVESMNRMFYTYKTGKFNQDISDWDVEKVTECERFKKDALLLSDAHTPNFQNCSVVPVL